MAEKKQLIPSDTLTYDTRLVTNKLFTGHRVLTPGDADELGALLAERFMVAAEIGKRHLARYRGIVNRQRQLIGNTTGTLGELNDLITANSIHAQQNREDDISAEPMVEDPDECHVHSSPGSLASPRDRVLVSTIDEIRNGEVATTEEQQAIECEENADKNGASVDESGEDVDEEEEVDDMRGDVQNKRSVWPRLVGDEQEPEQEEGTAEHYRMKVSDM